MPEHDERFRRIAADFLERPAGDYAELLRRGHVIAPAGVNIEEWRAEIRRQARRDKIKVRTVRFADGGASAGREPKIPKAEEPALLRREADRYEAQRALAARANRLGHAIGHWLRHDDETIAMCARCDARIYTRFAAEQPIVDGEALSVRCDAVP
ncbi:MAG: hypothetical protein ACR2LV_10490 [Solirubrobacteraceae bacterium]